MSFLNLGSIRKNLALLVLLTVLPAMAILFYSGMEDRRDSIEQAKNDVQLIAHTMAQVQKDETLSARQILSTLAIMAEVHDLDIQESNVIFKNIMRRNPHYGNIVLLDLNGNVLASGIPSKGVNLADRKHVRDALKTKEFAAGEYIIARVGDLAPAFPFAYPILDATGTPKAVLAIAIKLSGFLDLYHESQLPKKSYIAVTDHQGVRLLYSPAKATNPMGKPIKSSNWKIARDAQGPGIMTSPGSDGAMRIAAFEQVRLNDNAAPYMYVWAGVPEAFILAPANTILVRNLFLMLLATIAAFFVSWSLGRKTLITPINKLMSMTNEFAKGNFENRIDQTDSINEFERLTTSFHDMAESLSISQKKLQQSEDRFKHLSGVTFEGIVIHKEGLIFDVNESLTKMFGYTGQDLIGSNAVELLFPIESHPTLHENISKYIATPYEVMARKKDGTLFPAEIESRNIEKGDEYFRVTAIRDITERKQAAEQLRDSEFKFKLFVDHTHDWESWTDSAGNYIYISPSCERVTGYSQDEFRTNPQLLFDLVHPEYQEAVHQHFIDKSKQQIPTHSLVFPIVTKAGEERWIDHHCSPVCDEQGHYVGRRSSNRDISERKKAESALLESEAKLISVLRSAPVGIGQVNNRVFIFVNDQFATMLGYTKDELIGKNSRIIYPSNAEFERVGKDKYQQIQEKGTGSIETILSKKDGTLIDVFMSSTPVNQEDLNQEVTFSTLDITERKQAEQDHLELEIQLRQKFKMEAVGTMAGGIAHNFNNNLSIILGNVELSQLKANNPEINGLLSHAKIAIMRSRDLVSQIMTYSRTGSHAKAPLQLPIIVDETLKLLGVTIPSTIQLNQTISPDSYHTTINANASQIQEILLNLYGNAVHAMEEEGELNIILDVVELADKDFPDMDDNKPGRYAKISIQDSGCGMAPETQEKIFDPFFTTKELYEGTGMGLSTVQGIIDQHDGLIKVSSTLGKGSTFELYFPVIEQSQTVEPTPINEDLPKGSEKILFIDDDEMLATLGEMMLSEMGYQVTMMTNSTEALKLFAANPDQFDLVITDQTMPQITGKELIPKLKQIRPDIQTIICTGFSSKMDEAEAKKLGADAFMMKPLDLPVLLRTIRRILDGEKE